jgi:Ala-tRNA(Pro) deacylase
MMVVPASHELQISQLAPALGAHAARRAEEPEFGPMFSDCELGAMPPFGNLYGLQVFADVSLAQEESIVFQAGTHTDTMRIKYADFVRLANPRMVHVARRRRPLTVFP